VTLALFLALGGAANAEEIASQAFVPHPIAGHPVLDMRVGVDRIDTQHPFICGEVTALAWLSVEGCGTGSGFLHHGTEPEMAHFRTRGRVWGMDHKRSEIDALIGVGFAEIQVDEDAHGFKFGQAKEENQVEAAGAEISGSAKGRFWVDKGGRTYVSGDLNVGMAYIPAAPVVTGGDTKVLPFAAVTVGFGF